GAEHAHRARLLVERDDTAGPGHGRLFLHRVVDGCQVLLGPEDRPHHRVQENPHALGQADSRERPAAHSTTLKIPVRMTLARAMGMSHFQASDCSWSWRTRGNVQRNQIMAKTRRRLLPTRITGPRYSRVLSGMPGRCHPPRKSVTAIADIENML